MLDVCSTSYIYTFIRQMTAMKETLLITIDNNIPLLFAHLNQLNERLTGGFMV